MAKLSSKVKFNIEIARKKAEREAFKYLLKEVPRYLRERTSAGIDVNGKHFPELADSTIKFRNKHSKGLSKDTFPELSNVTATGQLIKAIQGIVTGNGLKFTIKEGERRPGLGGVPAKGLTNDKLREYLEEKGFEFFGLNDKEIDKFTNDIYQIILKSFEQAFNA